MQTNCKSKLGSRPDVVLDSLLDGTADVPGGGGRRDGEMHVQAAARGEEGDGRAGV